ncbi:unnamed protein product, partial [Ectocarpus sp. 12 AP-2014]
GLTANSALLCLAAIGIDLMLPNVSFDVMADEEIERMKEEFHAERSEYLDTMSDMAGEAFHRIESAGYKDIIRWAENEITFKVIPKARAIELATAGYSQKKLRTAGYSFWKNGTPAIGSAYLTRGLIGASITAAEEALKVAVNTISAERERRSLPEVAYAAKISDQYS